MTERAVIDLVTNDSHVLIHVPHSSRTIPVWARPGLLLDDAGLSRELDAMTDSHTDLIARTANDVARKPATLLINGLSRLVVDPERFPDDREEMLAVGMGAVYTHGHDRQEIRALDEAAQRDLIDSVFTPYARRFADTVNAILHRHDRVLILDLHSYPARALPYELHADGPRRQVCLGTDSFHTPAQLLNRVCEAFAGFDVGINTPFAGTYVPMEHYLQDRRVQSLMVEIRRDTYLDESLSPLDDAVTTLASALAQLIDVR